MDNFDRIFIPDVVSVNLQGVIDYIASGQDLNVENSLGQTALIIGKLISFQKVTVFQKIFLFCANKASINNNQAIVKKLIAANEIDINAQDSNGDTALILGKFNFQNS